MSVLLIMIAVVMVYAESTVCKIGDTEFASISGALPHVTDNSIITLISDANENITIDNAKTVSIDLNGHILKGSGNASVINVGSGAVLTIMDSNPTIEHKYIVGSDGLWTLNETATGTATAYDDLTALPVQNTVVIVTGGAITGGTGSHFADPNNNNGVSGAGIFSTGGTVNLQGGNIIGNKSQYVGGGICISVSGNLNITGGRIVGNSAQYGGGISMEPQSYVTTDELKFTMTGGEISYNTVTSDGGATFTYGIDTISGSAKIYRNTTKDSGNKTNKNRGAGGLVSLHKLSITENVVISGNISDYGNGGGIFYAGSSFTLGGRVDISGNKVNGADNNVYLTTNKVITFGTGNTAPNWTNPIGITTQSVPTDSLPVAFTGSDSTDYKRLFKSDKPSYCVINDNQVLKLSPHEHNWKYVTGTGNDSNKVYAYCNTSQPSKCAFYGESDSDLNNAISIFLAPFYNNYNLKATMTPDNATYNVSWSSSNESVVTIDKNGTINVVAPGTATVTAESIDGSNLSATCTVTVQ